MRGAEQAEGDNNDIERLENWNARIARLFIGGGDTAPLAEDTADVVFKVQLNDGGAGDEVLFKVPRDPHCRVIQEFFSIACSKDNDTHFCFAHQVYRRLPERCVRA